MCGIAGFSTFKTEPNNKLDIIGRMCDAIALRGPDEWATWADGQMVFGHRRLSIVGLSDGKQPMSLADRYTITFNGEIYNFRDLRKELEADGVELKTSSDTEVILHFFAKYGTECFSYFNGMFALAIWDAQEQKLILARDRMGKKPLFYYYKNNEIIFASELKALVQHPYFTKTVCHKGLDRFLTYEYIPTPHTIFENTYKLEAAQFMVLNSSGFRTDFYWSYPSVDSFSMDNLDENQVICDIEDILSDAIKLRLQADVPVGIFLSGGIDSSLITALASKNNNSGHKLKTFSIYFNEKSYDESQHIETITKRFDVEHHAEVVSSRDMLGLFPKLGAIMDEPMADASLIPTYFLSKIAAAEVKTVLSGDGADELFAGYPTYIANKLINIYNIIPYNIRDSITRTVRDSKTSLLPVSFKNMSLDHLLKQFFRGAGIAGEIRFFKWMGGLLESEKSSIYNESFAASLRANLPYEDLSRYLSRVNIYSELDRLLYLSQKLYLMDDILVKVDRASMMNSLEVRVPFLDYRLVEYAAGLPDRFKLNGFKTKYILKKLALKHLPKSIVQRPKKGFGIPISTWLNTDLRAPMLELLGESRLKNQGIFEYAGVKELIDGHFDKKMNNRKQLWTLVCFQLWADEFMR